jgi:hypothetical protein
MPSSRFFCAAVTGALLVLTGCEGGGGTNTSADGDFCQVVQAYVPPDDCADFEKQAARQTGGTAAFNAPNPLDRGESFTVWLAVAANRPKPVATPEPKPSPRPSPSPEPSDAPSGDPAGDATDEAVVTPPLPPPIETGPMAPSPEEVVEKMPGHVERFDVVVADYLAADLEGDESFEIKPLRDRTQRVHLGPPYPPTAWGWQVTPKRGGDHMMTITTTVQVKDREGQYWDVVSTPRSYGFKVKVGVLGYVQDSLEQAPFWLKLVTGVVVALTALVLALSKLRNGLLELLGLRKPAPDDKTPPPQG